MGHPHPEEPVLTQDLLTQLNEGAPAWLSKVRTDGFGYFEKASMPSNEEAWKYIELDFDLRDLPLAAGEPLTDDGDVAPALADVAGSAVIVDGYVDAAHGPLICRLADASERARTKILTGTAPDLDIFTAAHHAFVADGVVVEIPDGRTVADPIFIDVQSTVEGVSFPHITIVVGGDADASIIIGYRSPDGVRAVTNPNVEVFVADGARLRLSSFQRFGDDTRAIIHQPVRMGRDSTVRLGEVGLGGRLARLDLDLELVGIGASTELVGAYYGERRQVLDYRLLMHHVGPRTNSDVFLKGAVQDTAESAFIGLVKIEKDAAKVSAFETNRNLVLSEGASANSVPNLEILCDDVICGHGSAVGPLEEEPLYYLMSRGLPKSRASRLLVHGFFEEALNRLPHPELEAPARAIVDGRFRQAQEEGRVL